MNIDLAIGRICFSSLGVSRRHFASVGVCRRQSQRHERFFCLFPFPSLPNARLIAFHSFSFLFVPFHSLSFSFIALCFFSFFFVPLRSSIFSAIFISFPHFPPRQPFCFFPHFASGFPSFSLEAYF